MKKFIALFFSLALLTACSNDDDNQDQQGPEPIIGTWVLVDASTPLNTQFCMDEESTLTFNSNQTGQATFYLTGTNCTATNAPGTWKNNGNSNYTVTVQGLGDLEGAVNFSNNNNRFTFATTVLTIPGTLTFEKQ